MSISFKEGDIAGKPCVAAGPGLAKSIERMNRTLSIHEFSRISGVESSTLRYWDEIGIFSPLMRNPENNYRHYSPAQLPALNFVTTLSDLEIPLKTIAELRTERDPENLLELLERLEKQMDMEMRHLRQRYSIIHARRELINMGMKVNEGEISVVHFDEQNMHLWPRNVYHEGETFIEPLAEIIAHTGELHINLSFPVAGYHDNMESFAKAPDCPDHFLSIDPIGTYTKKGGDYIVGYARGYFGEVGDLPDRMMDFVNQNSINIAGPVFTIYLHEEICSTEPSKYLAKCSVAVSKKRKSGA